MVSKTIVREQLKSLDTLIDSSKKFDKKKVDLEGAPSALKMTAKGKMTFVKSGVEFFGNLPVAEAVTGLQLEPNAVRQLLGRVSIPFFGKGNNTTMDTADWLMVLQKYPAQFAAIFNDLLPQIESKGLLVRTDAKQVRAILTDKYGIVDNTQVLNAVRDILKETAGDLQDLRIVNSHIDRDRLDLRVVFSEPKISNPEIMPQGETRRGDLRSASQPYGLGVFVTNEETGCGGLGVKSLVWRGPCTNSIIVNTQQSIAVRHIGQTEVLIGRLQQAFADALPVAAQTLNRIYEVTNKALPNLTDVLNGLSKQYGWDDDAQNQILIGTEGQETVMGLVNGVSFAASKIEDSAQRVEMETQAGNILVANDSLFARAAQQSVNARK